jgi:predicted AlkP superfamily phosphohydrolase/phosphomutase
VKEEKIWDILGSAGMRVCVIGVPPSYPPFPVNGELLSCFITPDANRDYTFPVKLKEEVESLVGPYPFDVEFRTDQRDVLLKDLHDMTDKHFKVIEHLLITRKWDFFMFVEIGTDRMHHAFWKFYDENHPKYVKGNPYENAMLEYYKRVDKHIGRILQAVNDDTVILLVSDHGAKGMRGAFCVNEWLIREGYLVLKEKPQSISEFEKLSVDWSKTKAWAWGGYYARVFFNVKGREPEGIIDPKDFDRERNDLTRKLKEICDPRGRKMETQVYKPEDLYSISRGDRPDLMVYFDNLFWRSAGTVGHGILYLDENDTGPDDAVHAEYGIFVLRDKRLKKFGRIEDVSILDIAPTLLKSIDVEIPRTMEGKPLQLH